MKKIIICLLLLLASSCGAECICGGTLDGCPFGLSTPSAPSALTRLFAIKSSDTAAYPYSAVGVIDAVFDCGCKKSGTVFMVGKCAAMTASHCVVCYEHNGTLRSATFSFGLSESGSCLARYADTVTYWYGATFPDGYTWETQESDYAYIRFNRDIGTTTGWFGTKALSDGGFDGVSFVTAGYADGVFSYARGTVSVYDENQLTVSMHSDLGNSGAPVFTDDYYAVGITTSFTDDGTYYACRIRDFHISELTENGLAEG